MSSATTDRTAADEQAHNALASLYGAGEAKRRATASAHIGPGRRSQEIYTPPCVIEAVLKVWPYIQLDPCTGPGSIVPARHTCYVSPKAVVNEATGRVKVHYEADVSEIDGKLVPWPDYTYVNPPFALLQQWLRKAQNEGETSEVMLLCPNRTSRKWFRAAAKSASAVAELNPLKFLHYKQAFPAPLCVMYWGQNPNLFAHAFESLGEVR